MSYLKRIAIVIACWINSLNAESIYDESRNRAIPIEITLPGDAEKCSTKSKCPVVFLSAGYGISYLKYTFISKQLNQLGYLVIAIGHELPNDPALSVSENLYETRSENWSRGAQTLDFLKNSLSKRFEKYDFEKLTLIGHSNGGDISAWLANQNKTYIQKVITLDHRRVPLPRNSNIRVLSIRASDFPADKGVLLTDTEQQQFESCIVKIPKAKHNDIADFGPMWLKEKINLLIKNDLNEQPCSKLKKA
jgi:pimeloyl-ACP methyl ester carboxylesterase